MLYELQGDFERVLSLFEGHLQDPLMHAALEGHRPGRIFVDDPARPQAAFVWPHSECAYLVGGQDNRQYHEALHQLVVKEIIPAAGFAGRDFLSLFSFPNSYAVKLEALFQELLPLRTALNTFSFHEESFYARQERPCRLPRGLCLQVVDGGILTNPDNQQLADEITFHWGSVDSFPRNLGHCVLAGDEVVSWCYVQAIGQDAQTIDIWTAPGYRRKGLGSAVASAFIAHCLSMGHTPFWLCDKANVASRELAKGLGFELEEDISVVDIPFAPFEFYQGLARHFFSPREEHRQAAEAYERAFTVQEGGPEDYYHAASAWAAAGDAERARANLQKAIERGWEDATSQG